MAAFRLDRFHRKIAFAFCVVLLLATALSDLLLSRALRERLVDELSQGLAVQARLIGSRLKPGWAPARDARSIQFLAHQTAPLCGCRVTFIAGDGSVLGDSELDSGEVAAVENHRERPEVRAALAGREGRAVRFSRTVHADLLYAAVPLDGPVGSGVVRAALPLKEVSRKVNSVRLTVAASSLVAMLAAVLLALWISRSLGRRVNELSVAADRLADGDLGARLGSLPQDDLGRLGRSLNVLAERIQGTIEELSGEKSQLSTILSNIVEGVAAVDPEGRLIAANPALCELFRLRLEEVLNRPFAEAVPHARLNELLSSALKERRSWVEEVEVRGPGERHFEAHAVPLAQGGAHAGALLVLHDISRIRMLERMRRDFVANVSHELRTPLASIRGFAETLRGGAVEDVENRMEFIETIEKDAVRLTAIVDDLLDLSAIESGQRRPALEELDPLAVARDTAASLKPLAERGRVSLLVMDSPSLPKVRADRAQLKQVFTNLIANAVKFNREGGSVTVSAEAAERGVRVLVRDTGQGIPQPDLARIFERFYRVDKARSRELGGTGLGLSIVKHIIEAHGGAVGVESAPGEGSTFHFTLPAA